MKNKTILIIKYIPLFTIAFILDTVFTLATLGAYALIMPSNKLLGQQVNNWHIREMLKLEFGDKNFNNIK